MSIKAATRVNIGAKNSTNWFLLVFHGFWVVFGWFLVVFGSILYFWTSFVLLVVLNWSLFFLDLKKNVSNNLDKSEKN